MHHHATNYKTKELHHGYIVAEETDRHDLESKGIILGEYRNGIFTDCVVTDDVLENLDIEWGRYYWKFQKVQYFH